MKILVINGPNLNLLGEREKSIYGDISLDSIEQRLIDKARMLNVEIEFFQSNSEGEIVNRIQEKDYDGVVMNAAAYAHTSIAIRDALLAVSVPFIEVHISNVYKREPFRHNSYLSDIALGVIVGFGIYGYEYALDYLVKVLRRA
ncbi:type II 3-dehydroquinate dehydratase [Hippea alviniae]|uniref:type II 3-dehydroquinate dehydratase n=1 Tax=Hippea alviniae TaxID=1279027 RepID=UPI000420743C|nr:type II 3-dehydroquinate dehydratase [Hippea alviniae]